MKMLIALATLIFSLVGHAQIDSQFEVFESIEEGNRPIQNFDPSELTRGGWLSEFPLVIVVNKSNVGPLAQTVRVFKNGQLIHQDKVSTGREKWEPKRKSPFHHGPAYGYYSTTGTGYFSVQRLSIDHYSQLWRTAMPFAVFFNEGIALHQAPVGTESKLGTRASGGCVRQAGSGARFVFSEVQEAGTGRVPSFTRAGEPRRDAAGNIIYKNAFRTLVIVENREN
jgi:hypothetical protein